MRVVSLFLTGIVLLAGCASAVTPTSAPAPRAAPTQPAAESQSVQIAPKAAPPQAQQGLCNARLMGELKDSEGDAVVNATVDVKSSEYAYSTITDEQGQYGFYGLCRGNYQFVVTPQGGASRLLDAQAVIDGRGAQKVDLTLK